MHSVIEKLEENVNAELAANEVLINSAANQIANARGAIDYWYEMCDTYGEDDPIAKQAYLFVLMLSSQAESAVTLARATHEMTRQQFDI